MSILEWIFDGLIGLCLLWLGVSAITLRGLFSAVIAFIALGIVMALAWVRLRAPDLAIAEAALGGGVTGALLLNAINRIKTSNNSGSKDDVG